LPQSYSVLLTPATHFFRETPRSLNLQIYRISYVPLNALTAYSTPFSSHFFPANRMNKATTLPARIQTERLILRQFADADTARLFEIYGDPRTNLHNPHGPMTNRAAIEKSVQWRAHWQQHGFGQWAIALQDSPDHVLGFGGVSRRNYGEVERLNLGYRFAPAAWGKGYATEMARQAVRVAFDALTESSVWALVRRTNTASIHVAEKLGMRAVGELDDVPGWVSSIMYRLDRSEATTPPAADE
jgi:[ribosomal protein S5]-alanine N-acetyltransferase